MNNGILNAGIHNRFDLEVVDAKTGEVKSTAYAENTILNQMWSKFKAGWAACIHVGSGTGTPSAEDTQLFNYLSSYTPNTSYDVVDYSDAHIAYLKRKISISETSLVGNTLTEVGIGISATKTDLVTHAMLKDMNGNQISIQKTNTDIINVYATVFCHFDSPYICHHFSYYYTSDFYFNPFLRHYVLGAPYGCTTDSGLSSYRLNGSQSRYGSYWQYQSPFSARSCYPTYDSASRQYRFSAGRFAVADANTRGENQAISIGAYQGTNSGPDINTASFIIPAAALGGSDIVGEAVATGDGTSTDFKTKFGNISNVSIFVNGVEASNVVCDTNIPFVVSGDTALSLFKAYTQIGDGLGTVAFLGGTNGFCFPGNGTSAHECTYENLYNDKIHITKLTPDSNSSAMTYVMVSNGLSNWTQVPVGDVPAEYGGYRYIKIIPPASTYYYGNYISYTIDRTSDNNIHFATPPAVGDVITANYHTDVIAKDSDHVFDFSMTVQLGEYTATQ